MLSTLDIVVLALFRLLSVDIDYFCQQPTQLQLNSPFLVLDFIDSPFQVITKAI